MHANVLQPLPAQNTFAFAQECLCFHTESNFLCINGFTEMGGDTVENYKISASIKTNDNGALTIILNIKRLPLCE